jgi:hypothetical protein
LDCANLAQPKFLISGFVCRLSFYLATAQVQFGCPCVYHFFLAVVVIGHEATATARWALLLVVRVFFNDADTIAVWTGLHECAS